ncbi:MAG: type II CRISPR RNA-guided endonuclease Cas9 [Alistipes sp.]
MKKILALDLGTASIGWAVVNQADTEQEQSEILKIGVRVNPLTVDEKTNFEQGKSITTNADRTQKRSARRNLQRYKLRRENLVDVLTKQGFITENTILSENGNRSTFETCHLRADAASKEVSLSELSRVLLMINKKRGYKSSRKIKSEKDGAAVDGMAVAQQLYEQNSTPAQYALEVLQSGKRYIPDFYRSDLQREFDAIWQMQQSAYPELLTSAFKEQLTGKKKMETAKLFLGKYGIYTAENKDKNKRLQQSYAWRVAALTTVLSKEEVAAAICDLNGAIANSSGYLGAISDRSKELFFRKQTVGQFQMEQLATNPNYSLKNQVFYRQDYMDEFERIWETQAKFHSEMTTELKSEIRDIILFYQRKLKSQKGLISFCEFESRKIEVEIEGKKKIKTIGLRVCPRSSPVYQEFRMWQVINNLEIISKKDGTKRRLEQTEKEMLSAELAIEGRMSKGDALKLLFKNARELDLNYKEIEGNRTQAALFKVYRSIVERSGHDVDEYDKLNSQGKIAFVENLFRELGIDCLRPKEDESLSILHFNAGINGAEFEKQPMYRLWHLLYSFEGDDSKSGNEKLVAKLMQLYHFDYEQANLLANTSFEPDYGSLSTKAMRKILPFMKEGVEYSEACTFADYRHSKMSLTKEELNHKELKDHLELLPKNSLRNPVVEKILNQMIHVVNAAVECYGKPDEIHIELSRELKKNGKQREEMSSAIKKSTKDYERYRLKLQDDFGMMQVSRNDVIRYRLYEELRENGYKTLYSNTYIPYEMLFSRDFDVEHIIPQAKLFDDSFSNKTLECRSVNIDKGKKTAYDYVKEKGGELGLQAYESRIKFLNRDGSHTKYTKLKMSEADIPSDFINRELSDSQYIAKKAKEMLEWLVRDVVSTTGSITSRLREDWQLVDVMQELNWDKYEKLGLTEEFENRDGHKIRHIIEWTKRNDHRHHAMDALTIAFTKRSHIQYLNNLNARSDKSSVINFIEQKELRRDANNKLKFIPPMPLGEFRAEAKRHLEQILVSIKAKNKVMTSNINRTAIKGGTKTKVQLTPRGQLHQETIYAQRQQYVTKLESVGSKFDVAKIATVCKPVYRDALLQRLAEFNNDSTKAFTGKNSLEKNPIYLDALQTDCVPAKVYTVLLESIYTIRKAITPDLVVEKVVDVGIRRRLEQRLEEYGGDAQKAFSNLDENPIWMNEEKGIAIKRVAINGISSSIALHDKRDKEGCVMRNDAGAKFDVDFVAQGNNHHIAIYRDNQGELQESVVTFFEATERVRQGLPVVDRHYRETEGWRFLFTMKINEYFVFPRFEQFVDEQGNVKQRICFDPENIDLMNPVNYASISPNLFRVQALSSKDYWFRHHLETTVDKNPKLKNITYKRLSTILGAVKVRVNHLGQIVNVGEY